MDVRGVQIWGDSVLKGVVYDTARKRYTILRDNAVAMLSNALKVPLTNMSRMGRTAPEGLEAFASAAAEPLDGQIVVIEYGGNDCDFDWARVAEAPEAVHEPHTPAKRYLETITHLIDLAREKGGKPLLCTLPPLDCHRYLKWITRNGLSEQNILRYLGVPERIYRWQEYYSDLNLRASMLRGCGCLPLREMFLESVRGEDVLCADGIHPNELGHKLIAQAALAFAREKGLLAPA